ncbi:MAG: prolyl oligopeptidase family serine peptidase [Verrucomicrobia bacterium]|nr:prolyl oligopeptidase family serine peptidase [Verrucomicrobiota bacterium]
MKNSPRSRVVSLSTLLICFVQSLAYADGPADNRAESVRRVPPPGVALAEADRAELDRGVTELGRTIETLRTDLRAKPALLELLPDIQIFHNAVRYALTYNEFFNATNEVTGARALLAQGNERAEQLRAGAAPWTRATGLVVRGYVSKIDGSVQPYGLVVPASYATNSPHQFRLDAWFHGRGETLSELNFLRDRQRSPGEFTPPHAFVLHLYGRYCNANKFAGEIDFLEALEHVRHRYSIDENRVVVRGFSMGGAACWQFAVHYAGRWAAAAPGAGFSETADFLKVFQKETVKPAWYEQKLWHMYDCTDYAANLFNCPTVAYSGEIDSQKQAADMMAKALQAEGIELTHVIGPQTGHKYHPASKEEINRRIDSVVATGRDPVPDKIRFTTWTLRYNEMLWLTVDGLEQHWERARVDAELDRAANTIKASTKNVTALTFSMPAGRYPFEITRRPKVILDGQKLEAVLPQSDRSWTAHFSKLGRKWIVVEHNNNGRSFAQLSSITPKQYVESDIRKRHGLQGPIDDAFMDSFVMVRPTGEPLSKTIGAWVAAEQAHAIEHWRRQFRGEARVVNDDAITDADIAAHNLILWGDPRSNKLLARIADKLPVRWDANNVRLGRWSYAADQHIPVLIYPNPLNPKRYVVLNSGFTFREYDYLNNARQISKLPDFAVIDVDQPVTSRAPGGIVAAGFFNEHWALPDSR